MTQDEIMEMAEQAGMTQDGDMWFSFGKGDMDVEHEHLVAFAKLVAAKEREACAKLLESRKTGANELMDAVRDMEAKAIRARGEQA
jgi:hypothetical protein